MKKLVITIIILIFLMGISKSASASSDENIFYKGEYSEGYFNFEYKNNTSKDSSFDMLAVIGSENIEGYPRLFFTNGYRYELYYIFTKNKDIDNYIMFDELDYRYTSSDMVFYSYDLYDYIKESFDYKYVHIAKRETFDLAAYETYGTSFKYRYKVDKYKDCITIEGASVQKMVYNHEYSMIDDANHFLKITSIYPHKVELIEGEDWYDFGENHYKYLVTDTKGNSKEFDLTLICVTNEPPVITTKSNVIAIDINNPKTLKEIKYEYFKAIDEVDGDLTGSLDLDTRYNSERPKVGEYDLIVTSCDRNNYGSTITCKIVVFDTTGLVENYRIVASYSKELELEDIVKLAGIKKGCTYRMLDENYSENPECIGEYYINLELTNEYGFTYPIELEVNVVDDIAPVIVVSPIETTSATVITDEEILSSISVLDYSKVRIEVNKDEYVYDMVGEYNIYISVTDAYNNTAEAILPIKVAAVANINYYNHTIRAYNDYALTQEEVISFLREISNNKYDSSCESYVESEYFNTPFEIGKYSATLVTVVASGSEIREDYTIEVLEVQKSEKKKKKNLFRRIIAAIVSIFKMIIRFFKRIFRFLFH